MSKGKGIVVSRPTPTGSSGKIIVSEVDPPNAPPNVVSVGEIFEMIDVNGTAPPQGDVGDIVECSLALGNVCEVLRIVGKAIPATAFVSEARQDLNYMAGKVRITQPGNPNPTNAQANVTELSFVNQQGQPVLEQLWPNDLVECIISGPDTCLITRVVQHVQQPQPGV